MRHVDVHPHLRKIAKAERQCQLCNRVRSVRRNQNYDKALHIAQRQLRLGCDRAFGTRSNLGRYVASLIRRFGGRCSKNGIDGILSAGEGLLVLCLDEEMQRLFGPGRRPVLVHRRVEAAGQARHQWFKPSRYQASTGIQRTAVRGKKEDSAHRPRVVTVTPYVDDSCNAGTQEKTAQKR